MRAGMESEFLEERDDSTDRASAERARELLESVGTDGARLAAALVTPWWYHPLLGAIIAMLVAAQVLPGAIGMTCIVIGLVALALLPQFYARRYGVSVSKPAGQRSRGLLFVFVGLTVAVMAAGLMLKLAELDPVWVLLPMAIACVGSILIGRRYDAALRQELARSASPEDSGAGR